MVTCPEVRRMLIGSQTGISKAKITKLKLKFD
jgi:hypothetical protein